MHSRRFVYVDKCVLPDRFGQKFVRAAESQAAGNQGRLPIRTQRGVLQNTKYERLNTIILNETELNITGQNGVWFGCMVCRHHQCQLIHKDSRKMRLIVSKKSTRG